MTEEPKQKSDDELLMDHLCGDVAHYNKQLEIARTNKIKSEQAILNFRAILTSAWIKIKVLERKGIKQVEVKPDEGRGEEKIAGRLP